MNLQPYDHVLRGRASRYLRYTALILKRTKEAVLNLKPNLYIFQIKFFLIMKSSHITAIKRGLSFDPNQSFAVS